MAPKYREHEQLSRAKYCEYDPGSMSSAEGVNTDMKTLLSLIIVLGVLALQNHE